MSIRSLFEADGVGLNHRRSLYWYGVAALLIVLALGGLIFFYLSRETETVSVKTQRSDSIRQELEDLRDNALRLKTQIDNRVSQSQFVAVKHEQPRSNTVIVPVPVGDAFKRISSPSSEVYIPSGSVFLAQLLTPIKTSIQESFVMAQTTHEFRLDAARRIPKGSRLIGSARLDAVLKGVIVRFHLIVSPKGIEYPISLLALSPELFPELEGIYFTNELETYSGILALGFIEGFADAARDREQTVFGGRPRTNLKNNLLGGISTASFRVAEDIIGDVRRRAVEYVVVPSGKPLYVVFDRRFVVKAEEK